MDQGQGQGRLPVALRQSEEVLLNMAPLTLGFQLVEQFWGPIRLILGELALGPVLCTLLHSCRSFLSITGEGSQ